MFKLEKLYLSDVNSDPGSLDRLFEIFKQTLNPDLSQREFHAYLFGQHPDHFAATLISKDGDLAGFCTVMAYPRRLRKKKVVILRSAFGLKDQYKKGKFPLHRMFFEYMGYKLRHPFTSVWVAGFMANPLMYAMICKYTLTCFPRRNQKLNSKVVRFADDLMDSMNLTKRKQDSFVLKIHFQVKFKSSDIERFESSEDADVKYFLSINPGYREQMGVMVLVPVSFSNIAYTFVRYIPRVMKSLFNRKTDRAPIKETGKLVVTRQ